MYTHIKLIIFWHYIFTVLCRSANFILKENFVLVTWSSQKSYFTACDFWYVVDTVFTVLILLCDVSPVFRFWKVKGLLSQRGEAGKQFYIVSRYKPAFPRLFLIWIWLLMLHTAYAPCLAQRPSSCFRAWPRGDSSPRAPVSFCFVPLSLHGRLWTRVAAAQQVCTGVGRRGPVRVCGSSAGSGRSPALYSSPEPFALLVSTSESKPMMSCLSLLARFALLPREAVASQNKEGNVQVWFSNRMFEKQ